MRSPLALLPIALLSVGLGACGTTSNKADSTSYASLRATTTTSADGRPVIRLPLDRDNDKDNAGKTYYDSDDSALLDFGHPASTAESRKMATLVEQYYVAVATNDGSKVCPILNPTIAESVVEEYGQSPTLRGHTCAVVLSKLYKQNHRGLANDVSRLKVILTRVSGNNGMVLLRFGAVRERRVLLKREDGLWKINSLVDGGVP